MPRAVLSRPISDENATRLVARGLPWSEAEFLAEELGVGLSDFAKLTDISEATFYRRRRLKRFTPAESDHIMRFGRLWALAVSVFDGPEGARDWLRTREISLQGRVPLEVAMAEAGAHEVETLLKRIDFGIAS